MTALPPDPARVLPPILVVGVGNEWRGDDGVGIHVARALQGHPDLHARCDIRLCPGDLTTLVDWARDYPHVLVIDALAPGAPPSSSDAAPPPACLRIDALRQPLPAPAPRSTHAFGLTQAIALLAALDRLPQTLWLYAVPTLRCDHGPELSPALAAALPQIAAAVARDLQTLAPAHHPPAPPESPHA